jgi:tripartite-type tricarboxylate transporter receptor subunit TctC
MRRHTCPTHHEAAPDSSKEDRMDIRRRQLTKLGTTVAAMAAFARANAQSGGAAGGNAAANYPARPIRLIIPFAVGGGTDVVGRSIAAALTQAWGQSVVAENRAGSNSTIGLSMAARAEPDGYTLTMISASATVNVTLQGADHPYDLEKDFAPITQITSQPYYLLINPDHLKVKDVKELIALAKQRGDKDPLTYGSSGVGGLSHLSGALLGNMADIKLNHVPYKGGAPALTDVLSGHIDMVFGTRLESHALVDAGKLRALAVTTKKRAVATPDIPTMDQAGVPGYEIGGWYGIMAPAKTPVAIIDKLNAEIDRIIKTPEVSKRMEADGSEAVGTSPAAFKQHIHDEIVRYARLIKETGIQTG